MALPLRGSTTSATSPLNVLDKDAKEHIANRCCLDRCVAALFGCPVEERSRSILDATPDRGLGQALLDAAEHGKLDEIRRLIAHGADVDVSSPEEDTPLIVATQGRHVEVCRSLLAANAKINGRGQDGWTAVMFAAKSSADKEGVMLSFLLSEGADINAAGDKGTTALMLAGESGQMKMCHVLLEARANVNAKDELGTVLDRAVANKHHAMVEFLRAHSAKRSSVQGAALASALLKAAQEDRIDEVHRLISEGADVEARDIEGGTNATPLIHAARYSHVEVCRLLLQEGADVNASNGATALIEAATHGYLEVVQALLAEGADVNFAANRGWASLMYAAQKGHVDVCQVLLEDNADLNARTDLGCTALMLAVSSRQLETTQLLVKAGADVNLLCDSGHTALDRAVHGEQEEIEEVLRSSGAKRYSEL